MRTTNNLPFLQPFFTDWPQNTERFHGVLGIEDVVDDSLELECVVGVGHQVWGIGAGHVEGMSELCQEKKL